MWRIAISASAAAVVTPLLMRVAARVLPARRTQLVQQADARQFSRIDLVALVAMLVGAWTAIFAGIALHFPNSWWFAVYIFGWLFSPALVVVAACSLPRGLETWRDYWAAQEQQTGISHRFAPALFGTASLLGIIATFILYAHRNA